MALGFAGSGHAAVWLGALTTALMSLTALADEGWQVSGALRLRQENIDGQPRAQFNADERVLFSRTSLQVRYVAAGWRLVAEVQDSRSFGANTATPLTTNEVNALDLTQAYVLRDFNGALGEGSKLAVQAGRFSMSLGCSTMSGLRPCGLARSGAPRPGVMARTSKCWPWGCATAMPQGVQLATATCVLSTCG